MKWLAKMIFNGRKDKNQKKQAKSSSYLYKILKLIQKCGSKLFKFDTIFGVAVICVAIFVVGNGAYYGLGRNVNFQKILMKFQKFDLAYFFAPEDVVPSNYKKIEIFNNDIKKAIDEHKIISFDIFDTLLIRPYVKPTDLFTHLELLNNAPGFAKARIKAEYAARELARGKKEDITLDEIYQQIDLQFKKLKEKEMALEYQVLQPRPEIEKIYQYACKQKKKIIIISDMYLSQQFLADVLKKCGYNKFDEIFVSSKYGKLKASGSLYRHVVKKLGVSARNILHIGDNLESDIRRARQLGIDAFFVPKALDCLIETDPRIRKFYKNHKNDLGASIMLGLLATHSEKPYQDYWFDFGYKYAGPVIFGYMQWLDEQLKKDDIHKALFVARDGYTLEKVFNLIKTSDVQTHYIYLSRKIARKLLYEDQNTIEKARQEYTIYLNQFNLQDHKLAMVDSTTLYLSAQKALVKFFSKKYVLGYYWLTGRKISEIEAKVSFFQKEHEWLIPDNILVYFMIPAPTPPIKSIENGNPAFKEASPHELKRIKTYPHLSNGAVAFTKDYIQCFDKLKGFFSYNMLIDWMNTFCFVPTEIDKTMFYRIQDAGDVNHELYQPLFPNWYR